MTAADRLDAIEARAKQVSSATGPIDWSGVVDLKDSAADVPALVAALRAVLDLHRAVGAYLPTGQMDGDCKECHVPWPCPTVRVLGGDHD